MKVIRRDGGIDPAAMADVERRFKRELLLARQVTHKHVVRIHDLGEVNDTKYITMTFVDGEDLASTLERHGRLPVRRVLALARQIASGLEAAHGAGVVHRDLKPANIMIDRDDHALIMDFGVAQGAAVGPPPVVVAAAGLAVLQSAGYETIGTVGGETMLARAGETMLALESTGLSFPISGEESRASDGNSAGTGQVVGTPKYMSPEQSRGAPVDHRTDIYAFGLILTHLLLGKRQPPEGTTPWDALTERISQPPQPISARDPGVPEAFGAVITRCLQLDPNDRFAHTGDLVAALAKLDDEGKLIPEPVPNRLTPATTVAMAIALAAMLGATWWLARGRSPVEHAPVSVLVGDFTNETSDPAFGGLVEQALSVGVEGAPFISAFPHRDAMRVVREIDAGPSLDAKAARLVAMREGLDVTIGGSIATRGSDYVIRVNATSVGDQKVLLDWSTTAKGKDDVLAAVGRAAARLRSTLGDTNTSNASSEQETFTAASLKPPRHIRRRRISAGPATSTAPSPPTIGRSGSMRSSAAPMPGSPRSTPTAGAPRWRRVATRQR